MCLIFGKVITDFIIIICRRFLNILDFERISQFLTILNKNLLVKKTKIETNFFSTPIFLKFYIIEYSYNRMRYNRIPPVFFQAKLEI